jgi:hypothetical protein
MEEKKDEKKEDGTCVKGGCGIHCGCCACKMIKGLVLLLIGVGIGFCIAHCHSHRMYGMYRMERAASAQAESAPMPDETAPLKKAK